VFNLATKQKLGSHLMNDDVTFWTWISDSTLGMVTEREVFHWKVIEGQAAPQKVSKRANERASHHRAPSATRECFEHV
jgi:clathrin heavy chain